LSGVSNVGLRNFDEFFVAGKAAPQ